MATATTTKKPAAKTAPKPTLAQAVVKGDVRLFHQRQNGTLRRLPYFAPGTAERKRAEAVAKRRDAGETIDAIAADLKMSKATLRRVITGLLLAQAIEAGEHDKAWKGDTKDVVLSQTKGAA